MPRIRLVHKGLLLILVPLITSAGFIFYLNGLIEKADIQIDQQLHAFEVLSAADAVVASEDQADMSMMTYKVLNDEKYRDAHAEAVRRHFEAVDKLETLLKGDRNKATALAHMRYMSQLRQRWEGFLMEKNIGGMTLRGLLGNIDVPQLMERYLRMGGKRMLVPVTADAVKLQGTAAADRKMLDSNVQIGLLASVMMSLLLTLVMALFFHRNISERLRNVMLNIRNMAGHGLLSPPSKGSDQIAELDEAVHATSGQLRALEAYKRNLMSIVGNELRRPLTIICQVLEDLSENKLGPVPEQSVERVSVASRNMDRLVRLVDELAHLDDMEDMRLEMSFASGSLADIIEVARQNVAELAQKKRIEIDAAPCDCTLVADKNRLVQVVVNLLSNAIKFSPEGATIWIAAATEADMVRLTVRDQGRGMPKEFAKRLFSRFSQAYATDSTEHKGSGLGLAICKSIIEQHGGCIDVESEQGRGSTFSITLPLAPPAVIAKNGLNARLRQPVRSKNPLLLFSTNARLWQKGLVLIGLPLLFQATFVLLLDGQLQKANNEVDKMVHNRQVAATITELNKEYDEAGMSSFMAAISDNPKYVQTYETSVARVRELLKVLGTQLRSDQMTLLQETYHAARASQLEVRADFVNRKEKNVPLDKLFADKAKAAQLYSSVDATQNGLEKLLEEQRVRASADPGVRAKLRRDTDYILWAGLTVDVAMSLLLLLVIDTTITRRVGAVIANTSRLLKREPLLEPFPGQDEIADIDNSFYDSGQRLLELERFKDEMLSVVGHELRTPLSTVHGLLSLMRVGALGVFSDEARKRIYDAEMESNSLIELINNLLDIEKVKAGKMEINCDDLPLNTLVEEAISTVKPEMSARNIQVSIDISGCIYGDRARLLNMLKNVVAYSVRRSEDNSSISVSCSQHDDQLELSLSDGGPKMSADDAAYILDPVTTAKQGTKFDLSIALAKAIAERHGGQLQISDSTTGHSVFSLKLPRART